MMNKKIDGLSENWNASADDIKLFLLLRGIEATKRMAGYIPQKNILEDKAYYEIDQWLKVIRWVYPKLTTYKLGIITHVACPKRRAVKFFRHTRRSRIFINGKTCRVERRRIYIEIPGLKWSEGGAMFIYQYRLHVRKNVIFF